MDGRYGNFKDNNIHNLQLRQYGLHIVSDQDTMNIVPEIVQSIGWPHITLIIAVVFLFMFRNQIATFIPRINRITKEGVQIDSELNPQKREDADSPNILDHIEIEKTELLRQVENNIFSDLKSRNLDSESDTTKVLVRNLAVTKIYLDHEQSYNSIVGSQILLLKRLNEVAGSGEDHPYMVGYFDSVVVRYPEVYSGWTVDAYLNFLIRRGLMIKEEKYHITHKGQDFLIWLARSGRREDKGY